MLACRSCSGNDQLRRAFDRDLDDREWQLCCVRRLCPENRLGCTLTPVQFRIGFLFSSTVHPDTWSSNRILVVRTITRLDKRLILLPSLLTFLINRNCVSGCNTPYSNEVSYVRKGSMTKYSFHSRQVFKRIFGVVVLLLQINSKIRKVRNLRQSDCKLLSFGRRQQSQQC